MSPQDQFVLREVLGDRSVEPLDGGLDLDHAAAEAGFDGGFVQRFISALYRLPQLRPVTAQAAGVFFFSLRPFAFPLNEGISGVLIPAC
jgi:hypothetical protein